MTAVAVVLIVAAVVGVALYVAWRVVKWALTDKGGFGGGP
jgi:hypothetical protein